MHFIALCMSEDMFSQPGFTYIDAVCIAAFWFIGIRVRQTLHPRDEEGRKAQKKARGTAILAAEFLLLYALGRIILIVSSSILGGL
jgi:hypothetical protein